MGIHTLYRCETNKSHTQMRENNLITTFTQGRSKLLGMARLLLGNREDADDALQEAFSRLWPRAEQLRTLAEAEKVAMVTVRNLSIDQLRRQSEHIAEELSEVQNDPSLSIETEQEQDRKEQYRLVRQLIEQRLTPLQREILEMHDIEGLGYDEIARQKEMQEAAVRMQLSRARKTIRECYTRLNS